MYGFSKLRNCRARYSTHYEGVTALEDAETGEVYMYDSKHQFAALVSYSSMVVFYEPDDDILYLLPRYDYSVTTLSHVRKFAEDAIGISIRRSDIENGSKLGTTIVKCSRWQFMGGNWYRF